jgi:tRNA modification GTPase
MFQDFQDTICALATPQGVGAIGVVRVSGPQTFAVVNQLFGGKNLLEVPSHTIHFGTLRDGTDIVDEVLLSVFRGPRSYTREDVIEISCHGSDFIIRRILRLLLQHGCRMARPGEFTQRAFLNGQLDLAQAEAVADLIASDSEATHRTAINQIRGGFSKQLTQLREQLVHFASMVELELDFGEEDVEFANRSELTRLVVHIQAVIQPLLQSFDYGNAIKNGIPTVIVGKPNAGKSTLLNCLLNEERAIVSEIAGTTRDAIEDELVIEGIKFRLIDTAGLRHTDDVIEAIGVERTQKKIEEASVVVYLFDATTTPAAEIAEQGQQLEAMGKKYLLVGNKADLISSEERGVRSEEGVSVRNEVLHISAARNEGIDELKRRLVALVATQRNLQSDTVVTNLRHYEQLLKTNESLDGVLSGIEAGATSDWLAMDIRQALRHLGSITGAIDVDNDILGTIFSRFCIGK